MRPTSIAALIVCGIVAVSAFIIGTLFDLELLSKNLWLSAIKNGGTLAALFFALIHWLKVRPRIYTFTSDDWCVTDDNPEWNQVSITIPESRHKRGKTPTVTFLALGEFTKSQERLVYKIEEGGDVIICHDRNSFMPPWENFKIKITT